MNRQRITLAVSVLVFGTWMLVHREALPQNDGGAQPVNEKYDPPDKVQIAFVDVASVFKRSTRFKNQMEEMKKKVETSEAFIKTQQKRIAEMPAQTPGGAPVESPVADNAAKLTGLLNDAIMMQKKEFLEEEDAIYFEILQEINRQIEHCAKLHGIQAVFRVSTMPVNPKDRADIFRSIEKPIFYFDHRLDITEEVLAGVNSELP